MLIYLIIEFFLYMKYKKRLLKIPKNITRLQVIKSNLKFKKNKQSLLILTDQ